MILIVVLIWLRSGALRSDFHSRARSNSLRDAHAARETMTNSVRKAVLPNCIANCIITNSVLGFRS